MKGLMYKDALAMLVYKNQLIFFPAMILAFCVFLGGADSYAPSMMMMYTAIMSISLFTLDDNARWHRYAAALPLSRKRVVLARYLFCLLFFLVMIVLALLMGAAAFLIRRETGWLGGMLTGCAAMTLCFLLCLSCMAPVYYKLGESGRITALFTFLVPYIAVILGLQYLWPVAVAAGPAVAALAAGGLAVAAAVVFALSVTLSVRIYKSKDF